VSQNQEIIRKKLTFGEEEIAVAYRQAERPEPVGVTAAAYAAKGDLPAYVVEGLGEESGVLVWM
jgi:hypothetical protein